MTKIFMHEYYLSLAVDEARNAKNDDEVPVGAVVVWKNKIIGRGFNQVLKSNTVSAHAEIIAMNKAGEHLKNYRLVNCDLYVSVEPCYMCCMAMVHARIKNLYFGLKQPKTGAVVSIDNFFSKPEHNHNVAYKYLGECSKSKNLLVDFFAERR